MDADIASTLSGFALGEVLSSLDLDASALSSVQSQLGIRSSAQLNRDSIYADRFADDDGALDDEDLDDEREDYEAVIDREMREEGNKANRAAAARPSGALLRGEEDDFDEDYDEDDTVQGGVKQEPTDDARDLFGGSPSLPSVAVPIQVENLAPPPTRKVDVKELFPGFEYGKTLEFTDLFAMRPRKKRRLAKEGVTLALPAANELPRPKSTRDALLAPLRPLPPPPKGDEAVRRLIREARIEEMREVGEAGEEEGSEGEELRKAIERASQRTKTRWRIPDDPNAFEPAELSDWEDRIVWGPSSRPPSLPSAEALLAPRNALFEQGGWIKSILWDGEHAGRAEYFTRVNLNLNDTQMLLEVQQPK
ncbi:hypothetical protein JCM21900_003126, partial [Sporobolomyces salmonicolor]